MADNLCGRGAGLRFLNLGGGDVDTATPIGSMLFTTMAALAQMEHDIKRERVTDSISNDEPLASTWAAVPSESPTARSATLCIRSTQASPPLK